MRLAFLFNLNGKFFLKILLVFGTRPAAIKMAPVVKSLKKSGKFEVVVCVSAQHRQMLDSVLEVFEIKPDYDLDIMKPGQDLFDITTEVLLKIKPVLLQEKPDCVLVQGDTSTAISASLSAFYLKIPVGHVEAGLRTYRHDSPWPEELNRQIVGRIAKYHFAPTVLSQSNLFSENLNFKNILVTGNTVIDALLQVCERLDRDSDFGLRTRLELLKNLPKNTFSRKYILNQVALCATWFFYCNILSYCTFSISSCTLYFKFYILTIFFLCFCIIPNFRCNYFSFIITW